MANEDKGNESYANMTTNIEVVLEEGGIIMIIFDTMMMI